MTPLVRSGDTEGTQYLTMSASHSLSEQLSVSASVGYTWVANYGDLDYRDYKLAAAYTPGGWSLGAAVVDSDADEDYWYAGPNGGGEVK